jgi:plasmid maintenance system antidote protein VapI
LARSSKENAPLRQTRRCGFGTSAEFWINLQAMHDLTEARMQSGGAIERDIRPRAA